MGLCVAEEHHDRLLPIQAEGWGVMFEYYAIVAIASFAIGAFLGALTAWFAVNPWL